MPLKHKKGKLQHVKKKKLQKGLPKEIIVSFEAHSPKVVEKKKKYYEKADVILTELDPEDIKRLKKISSFAEMRKLAEEGSDFPGYLTKYFNLLKEEMNKGKIVIGTEISSKKIREKEFERVYGEITEKDLPRLHAEISIEREKERLKWIRKHLKDFKGKTICIDAGGAHTPIYHELKKALREEEKAGKIKITRKHLTKGMFESPQINEKFAPFNQIERIFKLKKELTDADRKRISELEKQDVIFNNAFSNLVEKYIKNGFSEEKAQEKAFFELSRKQRRKGLIDVKK